MTAPPWKFCPRAPIKLNYNDAERRSLGCALETPNWLKLRFVYLVLGYKWSKRLQVQMLNISDNMCWLRRHQSMEWSDLQMWVSKQVGDKVPECRPWQVLESQHLSMRMSVETLSKRTGSWSNRLPMCTLCLKTSTKGLFTWNGLVRLTGLANFFDVVQRL